MLARRRNGHVNHLDGARNHMDGNHMNLHNRNHVYHNILHGEVHEYRNDTLHENSEDKKHYLVFVQTQCLGHLGANPSQLLVSHQIASNSIEVCHSDLFFGLENLFLLEIFLYLEFLFLLEILLCLEFPFLLVIPFELGILSWQGIYLLF